MIRVVIDANVLVSAALARDPAAPSVRAFDAPLDGRIEAVGCPALLGEVAAVLGRERLRRYLSIEEARRFVADLASVMTLVADPSPPYPAVCRDPGDDYLVALARAARRRCARDRRPRSARARRHRGRGHHATRARRATGRCPVELRASESEAPVEQLIAGLTADELREVVSAAVDRHADVERQVRLIAARGAGGLAQLRTEVDRGLRTRRFLDYGESAGWARAAQPIVAELENAVDASPSR